MKAIVYHKYGSPDVLKLEEVEKPVPKDGEVLVKIHASSVNASDKFFMHGSPFFLRFMAGGLFKPKDKILGADIAGTIEEVGKDVKKFKAGDEVFGDIGDHGRGGYAEYVATSQDLLVLKPKNISFEEAAAVPLAAVVAVKALRDHGNIKKGQTVLINGASGGVGSFAVQIAKSFGAEVTAVCSTKNLETARKSGADHVIDYTKEDFMKNGKKYDLIIAANGNRSPRDYLRALKPGGIYVCAGGTMRQLFQTMLFGPLLAKRGNKKVKNFTSKPTKKDLEFIKDLIEAGKVKPVVDKAYPLAKTADAMRYFEDEHPKGKVVIKIL